MGKASYPYSCSEHPAFDMIKVLWDKNENDYQAMKDSLEKQAKAIKEQVDKEKTELRKQLTYEYSIEKFADGWMTIVRKCTSPEEILKRLDGGTGETRTSRMFKILENKYLIIGRANVSPYTQIKMLLEDRNGMVLEEQIVQTILVDGQVPDIPEWRM